MAKILAILVFATLSSCISSLNLNQVLARIPDEAKLPFLRHHIMRGFQTDEQPDYLTGYSEEFSVEVYKEVLKLNRVESAELKALAACLICWAPGLCADLCDAGIHP